MSNENNVPGTFPLSSPPPGRLSLEDGNLDNAVESAWTRDHKKTARGRKSQSMRVEAPTSDQHSSDSWAGALGASSHLNAPQRNADDLDNALTRDFDLGNVNFDSGNEHISWFDLPDDDDI
ncbi:hypothetical protein P692DRAFT_20823334, partial [Suillus brevipes Sb2]